MKKDPWQRRKNLFSSPVPKAVEKPKRKWKMSLILWGALKKTCMLLGAVVLFFSVLMSVTLSSVIDEADQTLPDKMVLYIELDGQMSEVPKGVSFTDPFSGDTRTLKNFIDGLENAKHDPRVKGVYANLVGSGYSIAHVQEMRTAIKDFRSSGKFAYIYSSSYGGGLGNYYLCAAFEEIWMQPMGIVAMTGINAEMPFFRDLLDKIGIEPNFYKRKEFKSAYESFTHSGITEPNKFAVSTLINDLATVVISDVSKDIGIDEATLLSFVNKGILLDDDAKEAGLVDRLAYADQLVEHINERVNGSKDSKTLSYVHMDRYIASTIHKKDSFLSSMQREKKSLNAKPEVALIYVVGAIIDSDGGQNKSGYATANTISSALLRAAEDDDIKAVVLRVNSPGGSPVASETILRAVEKVQESGKKVVVSMGPAAASGGYWVSAYADRIFVLQATITGSIGVLGGKVSVGKLWEKLGVNWDSVKWGDNSAMWSMNSSFSEGEAERVNAMLDNIYDGFLERVAKGRNMSVEKVDEIARGRVWSGLSAIDKGIADEVGGLNAALDYTAKQVGASGRSDVEVVILPKQLTKIEQFVKLLEGQVSAGQLLNSYAQEVKVLEPQIRDALFLLNAKENSAYAVIPKVK